MRSLFFSAISITREMMCARLATLGSAIKVGDTKICWISAFSLLRAGILFLGSFH